MFINILALTLIVPGTAIAPGTVIRGGWVYDGTGKPPIRADVRIEGDSIREVGSVKVRGGDKIINARGLAVAPGFIDSHSHADGQIFDDLNAETHIRQGITTSMVGEDGGSTIPIAGFFAKLRAHPCALNFGSFVGQGSVRNKVMGMADRAPTFNEMSKMEALVAQEMSDGAMGLSTGLEYEPNRYAKTEEVIDLAKVAAQYGGIYISHVRNEDNHAFAAFNELIQVAKVAKLPGEINHIKLGSSSVWHRASHVFELMRAARAEGVDITADVYPYLYWQSTIRVIISTEQFEDRAQWTKGLADIGGAQHVLLTEYSPNRAWQGKTLAEISRMTGRDPVTLAQEIVTKCYLKGNKGQEGVVVTAMSEDDLDAFIRHPLVSFCSDGGLHGTHPRGAGSFPRILGMYVRQKHILSLPEAIRKMTSLPAKRFGLVDRGRIVRGFKADLVLFDPKTVIDTATTQHPEAQPKGIPMVFVNGIMVLDKGRSTGAHPGRPLLHDSLADHRLR